MKVNILNLNLKKLTMVILTKKTSNYTFQNQKELDGLIRNLRLTKVKLLASRLMDWNLLHNSCRTTATRKRHKRFSKYFSANDDLCFCNDIENLFQEHVIGHKLNDCVFS